MLAQRYDVAVVGRGNRIIGGRSEPVQPGGQEGTIARAAFTAIDGKRGTLGRPGFSQHSAGRLGDFTRRAGW